MNISSSKNVKKLFEDIRSAAFYPSNLFSFPLEDKTVMMKADGSRVQLWVFRKWERNSFKQTFYGRVQETKSGSEIVGEFKMNLFARLFVWLWQFGVCFSPFYGAGYEVYQNHSWGQAIGVFLLALVFALLMIFILRFILRLAGNEDRELIELFLKKCAL